MGVPRPPLLGIAYAAKAAPIRDAWQLLSERSEGTRSREAASKLKSLATFEARAGGNPLRAGDPVARDRWPRDLDRDYGPDIPNLFRFELAERWRGYYSMIGEPGGVRIWILYLWDHETYNRQSGYTKK